MNKRIIEKIKCYMEDLEQTVAEMGRTLVSEVEAILDGKEDDDNQEDVEEEVKMNPRDFLNDKAYDLAQKIVSILRSKDSESYFLVPDKKVIKRTKATEKKYEFKEFSFSGVELDIRLAGVKDDQAFKKLAKMFSKLPPPTQEKEQESEPKPKPKKKPAAKTSEPKKDQKKGKGKKQKKSSSDDEEEVKVVEESEDEQDRPKKKKATKKSSTEEEEEDIYTSDVDDPVSDQASDAGSDVEEEDVEEEDVPSDSEPEQDEPKKRKPAKKQKKSDSDVEFEDGLKPPPAKIKEDKKKKEEEKKEEQKETKKEKKDEQKETKKDKEERKAAKEAREEIEDIKLFTSRYGLKYDSAGFVYGDDKRVIGVLPDGIKPSEASYAHNISEEDFEQKVKANKLKGLKYKKVQELTKSEMNIMVPRKGESTPRKDKEESKAPAPKTSEEKKEEAKEDGEDYFDQIIKAADQDPEVPVSREEFMKVAKASKNGSVVDVEVIQKQTGINKDLISHILDHFMTLEGKFVTLYKEKK